MAFALPFPSSGGTRGPCAACFRYRVYTTMHYIHRKPVQALFRSTAGFALVFLIIS